MEQIIRQSACRQMCVIFFTLFIVLAIDFIYDAAESAESYGSNSNFNHSARALSWCQWDGGEGETYSTTDLCPGRQNPCAATAHSVLSRTLINYWI